MKILPTKTELPPAPIERQHEPRVGEYTTYRQCLRWEFGFTCAFCFLHEADFVEHGTERTGLMSIEHHLRRAIDIEQINQYDNCFLACRFCNSARSTAPNTDCNGRHLLHPCSAAWGMRFRSENFVLQPNDPDAAYTEDAYDLNDPRKQTLRRDRSQCIESALRVVGEYPSRIRKLLELAERLNFSDRNSAIQIASDLQEHIVAARRDLMRFGQVPADVCYDCRCESSIENRLPDFLTAQGFELPD